MSKVTHLTRDDILIGNHNPVGKVIPEFIGQSYITTSGVLYISTDLTPQGWKVVAGAHLNSPVYVGTEEPVDTNVVWIDTNDEDGEEILTNAILLEEIGNAISKVTNQVKDIHYAFTDRLDSGLFVEDTESPIEPRRINTIQIKRGNKVDIPDLKDGELGYCKDTKELYIGVDGKLQPIGGGGSSSGGNITADYIELLSPNKTAFRVTVTDDGKLDVYDSSIDTAPEPNPSESGRYKGLIINQIYGGGIANSNNTPVSHGFIELYNSTDNPINLKGLSIQYKEHAKGWQCLQLRGIVPSQCSFLIRGAQHSNPKLDTVRCKIEEYDMSWDIPFTDKGFSVYLSIGRDTIGTENPFNSDGQGLKLLGYIDLLGCGGEDVIRVVDAYENRFTHLMSSTKAVHRKDFQDKDDNMLDVEVLDYNTCDVTLYAPRCVKSGKWDVHYDKLKLDPNEPNLINISFGKVGETTRTFSWQTYPTNIGFLRYRKKQPIPVRSEWTQVPTTKRLIQNHDLDSTVHNVIIRDLTPGIYEYQAGEEGKWTNTYEFEVKNYGEEDPITFLHVTDQQGWNEYEYHAWQKAIEYIQQNEEFDWVLNTGDISQNGNRAFEWRYYYHYAKELLRTKPHMLCVGNNDMIKTVKPPDSTPFTYYTNFEDSPYTSCHSYDVGDIHFVCLNSEEMYEEQIEWLKQDLTATTKRWVIAYMHVSPYTVIQTPKAQVFKQVFEDYGVHLVLCGHNHCYSRSQPMYKEQVDPERGVYYVMSQATGYKLSGKESPNNVNPPLYYAHAETPGQPSYIMWTVTKDKIIMKAYRINNIKPTEFDNGTIEKFQFDTVEIPYKDRRNLNVSQNL